jgi:hypothetical protein
VDERWPITELVLNLIKKKPLPETPKNAQLMTRLEAAASKKTPPANEYDGNAAVENAQQQQQQPENQQYRHERDTNKPHKQQRAVQAGAHKPKPRGKK